MKTVKEWINFLGESENYIFGLKLKDGVSCSYSHYYSKAEALERFADYLDEIVVEAFPMNFYKDNKIGALLVYEA